MQSSSRILDDIARLMTNAMGVAQGARQEAENAMKSLIERWLAEHEFVTREEFEAVRAMAVRAREENDALARRIAALEATVGGDAPAEKAAAGKKTARAASRTKAKKAAAGKAGKAG